MICSSQREIVFNQKTRKKAVWLSLLFGLSLRSLSLHQNWLIFCFVVVQYPHIPYALRCPCVYSYFLIHMQHWNHFYTKQNLHLSEIFEWIVELHTISLFLWQNWLWIDHNLFFNVLIFFMVPDLLGDNQKIGFKWK